MNSANFACTEFPEVGSEDRLVASCLWWKGMSRRGDSGETRVQREQGEAGTVAHPPQQEDSRYAPVRQYSLAQILAVWAAAAIPMAVLAWVIAPLLGALLGGGASTT